MKPRKLFVPGTNHEIPSDLPVHKETLANLAKCEQGLDDGSGLPPDTITIVTDFTMHKMAQRAFIEKN